MKKHEFNELRIWCKRRTMAIDDVTLVVSLLMFAACDDPLREKLGIKEDRDLDFIEGFRAAIVKYGGLTFSQRAVARRMVAYGMVHVELVAAKYARGVALDADTPLRPIPENRTS